VLYVADAIKGATSTPAPSKTTNKRVSLSSADLDYFARLVHAEAQGQPYEGQVAVAEVVLNRVDSKEFPNTVRAVIDEHYGSVPAFSPVDNGQINNPADASAKKAVQDAINGSNYSKGALFFYNPDLTAKDNWIRSRTVLFKIGDHAFCK
jgi:N-acetylmuramoyl-L-alanine amidase